MKKYLNIVILTFIFLFGFCSNISANAKTIYVSKSETTNLPTGYRWTAKNTKVVKVAGRRVTGKSRGTTTCIGKKKKKKLKITVVVETPRFNTTYLKTDTEYLKLVGTKRQVKYKCPSGSVLDLDTDSKGNDCVSSYDDDDGNGGSLTYVTAKVGSMKYSSIVAYGNVIPYRVITSLDKTRTMFDNVTTKKINMKFHVADTTIATIDRHGVVKGKRYGSTTAYLTFRDKKWYTKIFVLPNRTLNQKVTNLHDLSYFLNKPLYNKMVGSDLKYEIRSDLPKNIAGYFIPFGRTIQISNDYANDPYTYIHEYGHFIDHMEGSDTIYWTWRTSFHSIFKECSKEWDKDAYARESGTEYFAECFAMYVLDPYRMKNIYPKSYKWMNQFMIAHHYN